MTGRGKQCKWLYGTKLSLSPKREIGPGPVVPTQSTSPLVMISVPSVSSRVKIAKKSEGMLELAIRMYG